MLFRTILQTKKVHRSQHTKLHTYGVPTQHKRAKNTTAAALLLRRAHNTNLSCTKTPGRWHRRRRRGGGGALSPGGSPARRASRPSRGRSTASRGAWRRGCWARPKPGLLPAGRPGPRRSPATGAGSLATAVLAVGGVRCDGVWGWHTHGIRRKQWWSGDALRQAFGQHERDSDRGYSSTCSVLLTHHQPGRGPVVGSNRDVALRAFAFWPPLH